MNIRTLALALALAPAAVGVASANETFYFTYNDSAFKDIGATETGWVTIADTGLGVGGIRLDNIVSASVTVTGASSGNGVFGPADWAGGFITNWSPVSLNLSKQLVGQSVGGGCTYGSFGFDPVCGAGTSGDFNLFPSPLGYVDGVPDGTYYFTQQTDFGSEDQLGLVSLTTAPEPATWTLMGLGFAGLGFAGFRRANRAALAA